VETPKSKCVHRGYVTDSDFVVNLQIAQRILEPINKYIKVFQSDAAPISDVYDAFVQLPVEFQKLDLPKAQKEFLVSSSNERFDFIYGDAHGVAYMLDPRFLARGVELKLKRRLEDFIIQFPVGDKPNDTDQREAIYLQLTAFTIAATAEQKNNTYQYKMLIERKKSPLQYWLTEGVNWPDLQKVALRVFQVVPSSASCERLFSNMGFVHSRHVIDCKQSQWKSRCLYVPTGRATKSD
jgi:hypothetical protein